MRLKTTFNDMQREYPRTEYCFSLNNSLSIISMLLNRNCCFLSAIVVCQAHDTLRQELSTPYPTMACTVYTLAKIQTSKSKRTHKLLLLTTPIEGPLMLPDPPLLPLTSRPSTSSFALFNCALMSYVRRDLYVKHNPYPLCLT